MDPVRMDPFQDLAEQADHFISHLDKEYGQGEWELGTTILVADVSLKDGRNPITFDCSDSRRWIQQALLEEAVEVAEESGRKMTAEEAEEAEEEAE